MPDSFYWFDFEGFGSNPQKDRASQFAGVRTDLDFNIIESKDSPLNIFNKPCLDYLPHPDSVLLTGITPQMALFSESSYCESEFFQIIFSALSAPGTCGIGYNSTRYDDEIIRHGLFRNFGMPYARESGASSRWDLFGVVGLVRALYPDAIAFPLKEDGSISLRLSDLAEANDVLQKRSHDALSDAYAALGLAKLISKRCNSLFWYMYHNKGKKTLKYLFDTAKKRREYLVYASGAMPLARDYIGLVHPLIMHPLNSNVYVTFDFSQDPEILFSLSIEELKRRLFSTKAELEAMGEERLSLHSIAINKTPPVVNASWLPISRAFEVGFDLFNVEANIQKFYALSKLDPGVYKRLRSLFSEPHSSSIVDVDFSLYSGIPASNEERLLINQVWGLSVEQLRDFEAKFGPRYKELLKRYRYRNYPASLTPAELSDWAAFCLKRVNLKSPPAGLGLFEYRKLLAEAADDPKNSNKLDLITAMLEWGDAVENGEIPKELGLR